MIPNILHFYLFQIKYNTMTTDMELLLNAEFKEAFDEFDTDGSGAISSKGRNLNKKSLSYHIPISSISQPYLCHSNPPNLSHRSLLTDS